MADTAACDTASTELQAHLLRIKETHKLPGKHVAYLQKLKASGFEPAVIYDIGACVLQWTQEAEKLWPAAKIYLFDAFDKAAFLYRDYDHHVGVLSDTDGAEVKWYQNDACPHGNSYYREVGSRESAALFPEAGYTPRATRTLDSVVRERGFALPDLVKIDVQGAERDVIEGGRATLASARHLIVEMQCVEYNEGAPKVDTTLPFITGIGFECVAPKFSDNGPDADYGFVRALTPS